MPSDLGYDPHPMRFALAALCALFCAAPFHLCAADGAPTLGVLRLAEVLNSSKNYAAGTDKLKRDDAEVRAEMKKLDESLQKLDGQLQVLQPSNDGYAKVAEEFETTKLKRKIYAERMGAEIQRRHVVLVKETHKAVRAALASFCKERGIMMVMLAANPELTSSNLQEVQLEMGLQSVLYFEPANDITEAFIPYLNEKAALSAASAAPAPTPAVDPK